MEALKHSSKSLLWHKNMCQFVRFLSCSRIVKNIRNQIEPTSLQDFSSETLNKELGHAERNRVAFVGDGLTPLERILLQVMHISKKQEDELMDVNYICTYAAQKYNVSRSTMHAIINRMADKWTNHLRLMSATGGSRDPGQRLPDIRLQRVQFTEMIHHLFDFPQQFDPIEQELLCKMPLVLCAPRLILTPGQRIQCPAHNPINVIEATLKMLQQPNCAKQELIDIIKSPQFYQGGFILQNENIQSLYEHGFGNVDMMAASQVLAPDNIDQSNYLIKFTGIPYLSFSHRICGRINSLMNQRKLRGVDNAWVQSDMNEAQTVCVSVKPAFQDTIYNAIQSMYEKSSVQTQLPMTIYARLHGEEKGQRLDLKNLLSCWIQQRVSQMEKHHNYSKEEAKIKIIQQLQDLKLVLIHKYGYRENRLIITDSEMVSLLGLPEDLRMVVSKRVENQKIMEGQQSQQSYPASQISQNLTTRQEIYGVQNCIYVPQQSIIGNNNEGLQINSS